MVQLFVIVWVFTGPYLSNGNFGEKVWKGSGLGVVSGPLFFPEVSPWIWRMIVNVLNQLFSKACSWCGYLVYPMWFSCWSISHLSLRLSGLCQTVSWCSGSRTSRGSPWPLGGGRWGRSRGRCLRRSTLYWCFLLLSVRHQMEEKPECWIVYYIHT